MDVNRRLHEPILPIFSDMGKQCFLFAATAGVPSLYISRTAVESDTFASTTRSIGVRCALVSDTSVSPSVAFRGFEDEPEHS